MGHCGHGGNRSRGTRSNFETGQLLDTNILIIITAIRITVISMIIAVKIM